jgi:cytochrome c biogenesis protein CcdA
VIALEGDFAYNFILGVMSAVNPCGFVLLPTYLIYYLGTELQRKESASATLRRALLVGSAVSSGFVGLFLIVGVITQSFTTAVRDNSKYFAFVIGLALVVMGAMMLTGWKPRIAQPNVSIQRERTYRNMFLFGIAYAIASIGCTIGFVTSAVFGSVGRHGFVSGVFSIGLYGIGMASLVIALTVALAFAQVNIVNSLKKSFRFFDKVSAVFVLATGLYLTWYWYVAITERGSDGVTRRVDSWQSTVVRLLDDIGAIWLAIIFTVIIALAVWFVRRPAQQGL